MKHHKVSPRQICLAILSGGLIVLAFPRFNLSILAWFGLIPLFLAIRNTSPRSSFCLGWICGLVYFGGTLYWLIRAMTLYGHVSIWQSALIALALTAYLSLYIGTFAALWNWLQLRIFLPDLLIAPLVWTSLEFLRAHLLTGFPWSTLGYSQYLHIHLIQFADIAGVYGVSFLIVFVNAGLTTLLQHLMTEKKGRKKIWAYPTAHILLACGVMLILIEGYGIYKLHDKQTEANETICLGLIQGNIPQEEKWDKDLQDKIYGIYQSLTLQAAQQKPKLIIWPESSTPFINEQKGEYLADISPLAQAAQVPMIVGSPRLEQKGNQILLKNSAFFLSKKGKILDYYDKIHLVPFGEYLPLRKILALLGSVVNEVGEFSPGYNYTNFKLDTWHFGLVICYEIIFPSLFRKFIRSKTDFMINITNDAWYGRSSAPYQHFSMAVFRAIENGVPIVRVANTGISGIIDPMGRILLETPLFYRTALVKQVKLERINTFYTKYGNLFATSCLALLGLLLIIGYHHNLKMEELIHHVL